MTGRTLRTSLITPAHLLLSYQWRALNYCLKAFGNVPLGQHFVHITLMTVHSRGWHPTVRELTAITGLTRPSVSRHLNALVAAGLARDEVDGQDRRRRVLCPTEFGERQRAALIASLTRANGRVVELASRDDRRSGKFDVNSLQALIKMAELVRESVVGVPAGGKRGARSGCRPKAGRRTPDDS